MKKTLNIKSVSLAFFFFSTTIAGYTQESNCSWRIKVKNESGFTISKLVVLDTQFLNLGPQLETFFYCSKRFFPSVGYDITFHKKRKFGHIISSPIDHAGEEGLEKGDYIMLLKIKRKRTGEFEISYKFERL